MNEAAAELDYEAAARFRNRVEAVQAIQARQKVMTSSDVEADVIGFFREETVAGVNVLVVRGIALGLDLKMAHVKLIRPIFGTDQHPHAYTLGLGIDNLLLQMGFNLTYFHKLHHLPDRKIPPGPFRQRQKNSPHIPIQNANYL